MKSFPKFVEELGRILSSDRFEHCRWVAKMSRELAEVHGVDAGKAELAGLLHDCAKELGPEKMKAYWDEAVRFMDEDERECRGVWHAYVGPLFAKEQFGVVDDEILTAMRRHSVGEKGMCVLDAVVYIADACAPRCMNPATHSASLPAGRPDSLHSRISRIGEEREAVSAVVLKGIVDPYNAQRLVILEIARRDLWKGVLAVVTFKLGLGEEKGTVPLKKGLRMKEWVESKLKMKNEK